MKYISKIINIFFTYINFIEHLITDLNNIALVKVILLAKVLHFNRNSVRFVRFYLFNLSSALFSSRADNPLTCDCELRWYSAWIGNLRDKDDEMMSKKRTVCMMVSEHREYSVQNIPLERMGCAGKNAGKFSSSATGCRMYVDATLPLIVLTAVLV